MSKPSKKLALVCKECSVSFFRYKAKNRPQLFCSRECFLKSNYHREMKREQMVKQDWKGENSPSWIGEKVSYKGLHRWIEINLGRAKNYWCSFCCNTKGSQRMDWANLDGKYTRDWRSWLPLCRKCHVNYDKKIFYNHTKNKVLSPNIPIRW